MLRLRKGAESSPSSAENPLEMLLSGEENAEASQSEAFSSNSACKTEFTVKTLLSFGCGLRTAMTTAR